MQKSASVFARLNNFIPYSKELRALLMAFLGMLAYGGWAFFVNHGHGDIVGVKAAFTQGIYSFVITLVLTLLMENIFAAADNPRGRFIVTFLLTCSILYISSWGVNFLMRTPEILLTILPGLVLGTCYSFFYILSLSKLYKVSV